MVALGAQGDTYCEMHSALQLVGNRNQVAVQYATILDTLTDPESVLKVANGIYIQNGMNIKKSYSQMLINYFRTTPIALDFAKPDEAAAIINANVAAATNDHIRYIIPASEISEDTEMVLVNAIHFHSHWKHSFPINLTKDRRFFSSDGKTIMVKMMRQTVCFFCVSLTLFALIIRFRTS